MLPKDSKAFLFFLIFSFLLWQFGETIKKICLKEGSYILNNPIFSISYVQNKGGAWGIFQNQTLILALISFIILGMLIIYVYKKISFEDKFSLLLISILGGGILGNLIERMHFGYIIDYIELNFINFPIFNMFDIMISVSIFLYCLGEIFKEIKKWRKKQ